MISSPATTLDSSLAPPPSALNIVVIDGCAESRATTVTALRRMRHLVRDLDGVGALNEELGRTPADLLILDPALPGESDLSLVRRVRAAHPGIGIVILTAHARVDDKVAGYGGGADLYLIRPIAAEELGAAIFAVARRMRSAAAEAGRLTLDPATLQVAGARATVDVSHLECALLGAFADAPQQRLDFAALTGASGKGADECSKSTLEVQIVRLRKKLEEAGAKSPTIKSIRGIGYRLCVPLAVVGPKIFNE